MAGKKSAPRKSSGTAVARRRSTAPARRQGAALARGTSGPRDATVINTLAHEGTAALDAGDVDGARAVLASIDAYSVAMDARTGRRDPSKRKR